jgi:hypothetical protein
MIIVRRIIAIPIKQPQRQYKTKRSEFSKDKEMNVQSGREFRSYDE